MKKILMLLMMLSLMAGTTMGQRPQKATNSKERCTALTKNGTRCKLKVVSGKKFCTVHLAKDSKVAQCKAKTNNGTRCSRAAVKDKQGYCTQHYNKIVLKTGK